VNARRFEQKNRKFPLTKLATPSPHSQSAIAPSITSLQVLGSLTWPCKLLKVLGIHILKKLASAVQLRPWPLHFKALGGIASCPLSPPSVRYFSARSGSVPSHDDGEGLKLELPLAQFAFSPLRSAEWLKVAASIATAAAMRSSRTLCQRPYHRSNRGPSRAPTKAQSPTMTPYQNAMNGIESSGQ
jgi:hypothetical protein